MLELLTTMAQQVRVFEDLIASEGTGAVDKVFVLVNCDGIAWVLMHVQLEKTVVRVVIWAVTTLVSLGAMKGRWVETGMEDVSVNVRGQIGDKAGLDLPREMRYGLPRQVSHSRLQFPSHPLYYILVSTQETSGAGQTTE